MEPRRILVVDDEAEVVQVLQDLLAQQGYEVHAAYNAAGAIELVREHIFDAAILDFNLPDMDGVMLHRQLRQMDEELAQRTLFTSGLIQSESNMGYYATYGSGFLAKPFNLQQVLGALRDLWVEQEPD